jgi:uncharacterized protein
MTFAEWIQFGYAVLLLAALLVAVKNRETFPLAESVMVLLIVGIGFTGLVYLATLPVDAVPLSPPISEASLVFTALYVSGIAMLLVFRTIPERWKGHFLKEKIAATSSKLIAFVLIPLAFMRLMWGWTWKELGFSVGDVSGQILAAAVLILFFGGFNLLAGSAAAPVRKGQFTGRQVMTGFGIAFGWNLLETGLVEEFFFRAFLQAQLISALGSPLAGICLASLVFGLAHAPGIYLRSGDRLGPLGEKPTLANSILYSVIVLSASGWFTGLLYWRTQSLLAPVLVHAAVDAVAHTTEFIKGCSTGHKGAPIF